MASPSLFPTSLFKRPGAAPLRDCFGRLPFLAGLLVALAGCASAPAPDPLPPLSPVASGGGRASVTVVFESGLGDGADVWSRVEPSVRQFSATLVYSRRGYGGLLPALGDRSGAVVVEELRERLRAGGFKPPYLLVGHSLGGLYVHLFAKLYPAEVAGLVLVDPTHPDQLERFRRDRPTEYKLITALMGLNYATTAGAEFRGTDETSRQWHAAGVQPACPVLLLSAQKPQWMESPGFIDYKNGLQRELLAGSPRAEFRPVADSGHYIQREQPAAVIGAIREILAQLPVQTP